MGKRKRRSLSKEYKAEVVALVRRGGKSIWAVARDLDLSETAVRRWVGQAEIDSGGGPAGALTTAEREERATAQAGRDAGDGAGDPKRSDLELNGSTQRSR